ncbi:MAG: S8 family serine peptidase [Planctomycetota bacterium]|nr:S8 family serine peptidase [Planctomycetota bacterium]
MIGRPRSRSRRRAARRFEQLEKRHLLAAHFIDFSLLEASDYTHTEVLVRFKDDVKVDSLKMWSGTDLPTERSAVLNAPLGQGFRSDSQLWEMPVLPGQSVEELVRHYNGLDLVDFAEPNYRMQAAAVPNDQFYGVLWGLPDINAETAWDTRTDSSSIIVGVIDSGVEYDHPDLVDNMWTNSDEIAGNGIDDDGNGYVDDFFGYDFDNEDPDPRDDNGHGTHVAGTIGARGNNSIGVTGVGWNASLMALKVIGTGSNADVARAIDYATENGAKITNNSYGYAGSNVGGSQTISNAVGRAKNAGVLYVVAAGNSRSTIPASNMDGSFNSWPAELSKVHDNVITVAATDSDGSFASYSHWGTESVQIAAPGTQIGSTYTNGGYVYSSGTSMAAPHVAGAAALLWAERPELGYLDIKDAMLSTARPEHLNLVGDGVLDLGAAMDLIKTSGNQGDAPVAVDDTATVAEDSEVSVAVLSNDSDADGDTLTIESFTQGTNGSVVISGSNLVYTPSANFNGSDSFTYTINDGTGLTDTATVSVTVTAVNDNPVANDDSATTEEDVAVTINLVANDTDIDGDSLSIESVGTASNGSVVNNGNGTVTYTPNAGFFGSDSFTYVVSDGSATDTATVRVTVTEVTTSEKVIGYSGTAIDVTHVWKTINLPNNFVNPVVVAGGATRAGGHQGVVRVRNVTNNSFQIRFQEWDYRDGRHTTEDIGFLVMEAGVHRLTDGTNLVAGSVDLTNESFRTTAFGTTFVTAPLIISQVMTSNDPAAVTERIRNISTEDFQIQLNEEEAADRLHGTEQVGFIAIDTGIATSGNISLNALKTGNTVTHRNSTINFGSIDGAVNPVILSDMQTRDGRDAATVRHRSQTSTSVTVFVEEEGSRDSELGHTTEVVGVLAMEAGVVLGVSNQNTGFALQSSPNAEQRTNMGSDFDLQFLNSIPTSNLGSLMNFGTSGEGEASQTQGVWGNSKLGQLNSIVDSIMSELGMARNESISSLISFLRSDTDAAASVDGLFHHLKDELSE